MADACHKVDAVVILDFEGQRVYGKYYNEEKWPTVEAQRRFEANIHQKTHGAGGEEQKVAGDPDVLLFEGSTLLYIADAELTWVVVGGPDENELVLSSVLSCIYEAMQELAQTGHVAMEKIHLLEEYATLLLVVDETIDDGIIIDTFAANVAAAVHPFSVPENRAVDGANKAIQSLNKYLQRNL